MRAAPVRRDTRHSHLVALVSYGLRIAMQWNVCRVPGGILKSERPASYGGPALIASNCAMSHTLSRSTGKSSSAGNFIFFIAALLLL